jgi:hypothetical protein
MIIDIVTFIVTQGAQIVELVNAVLDAVVAIAGGGAAGVAGLVENALARSVPVLIGALAAILGIGGIASKIQKLVRSLAKPVGKAVDFVVDKIVKLGKKLWNKLKSKLGKKKPGETGQDDRSPRAKQVAVDSAIRDVERLMAEPDATRTTIAQALPGIKRRYELTELAVVDLGDDRFHVHAALNPQRNSKDHVVSASDKVRRQGTTYVLQRDNIKNAAKIVGEPESTVEADAAREAVAAELAASRGRITRVYLGTEADRFVNQGVTGETSVDAVGVTRRGMFMLVEAKGTNIEHGLEQLADSAAQLGADKVESYHLVVPAQLRSGLSGWRIQGYYLYQGEQPYLINGKRVRVVRTTRDG